MVTPPDGASASANTIPTNVTLGDVFVVVQSLVKKVDKIDAISDNMSELAINQVNTNTQLSGVEGRLDGLDARVIKLEEKQANTAASSNDPQTHVYGAAHPHHAWVSKEMGSHSGPQSSGSTPTLPYEGFDHAHRPSVLSCNAHGDVQFTKTVARVFFDKLLEDKGLKVEYDFDGQFELGKKFRLTFNGSGTVPVETAQCLLRARKGPDGKRKHFTFKDPDGNDIQLYFDEDKSPKSIKRESITNKFCNMLRGNYGKDDPPGKSRFLARKEEGEISHKGGTPCSISVCPDNAELKWNLNADFASSGIDKDAMLVAFKKKFSIEWCSLLLLLECQGPFVFRQYHEGQEVT